MNVGQIIRKPITSPAYPDPTPLSRYIREDHSFQGYTVFLEDATWNALCEIAREYGGTVEKLCGDINVLLAYGQGES